MAMAFAFSRWWADVKGHKNGQMPVAVVVDHRLRPESAAEARTVAGWLAGFGLETRILTARLPLPASGLQAWARRQRYHLLAEAALDVGPSAAIITAHHADDQAETVAMRLDHHSGLFGLAGMDNISVLHGVAVLRPLLDLTAEQVRAVIPAAGLPAVEDPSNYNRKFERVRTRQALSEQQLPGRAHWQRLAYSAAAIRDGLHQQLAKVLAGAWGVTETGTIWINFEAFSALPALGQNVILEAFIRGIGVAAVPRREQARTLLASKLMAGQGGTLGGCEWRHHRGKILCYREPLEDQPSQAMTAGNWAVLKGSWHVQAPADGFFTLLGRHRLAAVRRQYPGLLPFADLPARAFWSLPVFEPDQQSDTSAADIPWSALEDGTFIPHLNKCRLNSQAGPMVRFAGGSSLDWLSLRKERP